MLRFAVVMVVLSSSVEHGMAQDTEGLVPDTSNNDHNVNYVMSHGLERYFQFMDSLDAVGIKTPGYRIQLFSASGADARAQAIKVQSDFLSGNAQLSAYTRWSNPNWVVRVGDFRTRLEALELHMILREAFPASFIVRDEIAVGY